MHLIGHQIRPLETGVKEKYKEHGTTKKKKIHITD